MKFRLCLVWFTFMAAPIAAQDPVTKVAVDVNKKLVKIFGTGGFKGLPSYGTGIMVSPQGHVLTVNNHILTTTMVRVHLYDSRILNAKVIFREPELDLAMLKIEGDIDFMPHYDIEEAKKQPLAENGDWIFASSNSFQIATRDEPMSIMHGVVAAYSELRGRRGVFEAPFSGEVYFVDCIANNPGAAGGALTNRKGQLLGIVGRELKNTLTDTWINYAVPVQAKIEFKREDKLVKVDIAEFVSESIAGKYRQSEKVARQDRGGYTGVVLVANPVMATPPYVEEVEPGSPAYNAGLRPDDLILYVDGELVSTIKLYREIMSQIPPGSEIKMEIQRGNKLESIKLKVLEPKKAPAVSAPK